jgi:uncharacterized protein involved in exopolysaccharide biosynthesis
MVTGTFRETARTDAMEEEATDTEQGGGGGFDPELIKSYLRFFRRAMRAHRWLMTVVLVIGVSLTVAAFRYLPRTYSCTTILMVDGSQVLEGNNGAPSGLLAAEGLIMRHTNLETIVRETGLVTKFVQRRPPLLALKDRLIAAVFGEMSEETAIAALVGTLETRIAIKVDNGTLTVTADWTDAQTATDIADAARESYVKTRHQAEMSAFEEKLTILDGHAGRLREEIETLAKQARSLLAERADSVRAARVAAASSAALVETAPATALPRVRKPVSEDLEGPRVKETLERKRTELAELDRARQARIQEQQSKLEELRLRLTPSHPEVITAQQRLAAVSQEPSEMALLRAEVQSLEGELRQRSVLAPGSSLLGGSARAAGAARALELDTLPREIVQLLDASNIDPALAAQLSSAVTKYGALRDDIRSGKIQFDTAQAAFNFRYKVVVPAEPPRSPIKPKAAVVLGGGFILSLLLALALPLIAELRTGVIVERWQVAMMNLPVLTDLRLPASTDPRGTPPRGGAE